MRHPFKQTIVYFNSNFLQTFAGSLHFVQHINYIALLEFFFQFPLSYHGRKKEGRRKQKECYRKIHYLYALSRFRYNRFVFCDCITNLAVVLNAVTQYLGFNVLVAKKEKRNSLFSFMISSLTH